MFRLMVCVLFVNSCCSGYKVPTCKFIYPDLDEKLFPDNVCQYKGTTYKEGTTFWTPYDDCNHCYCDKGVLKCCLYGIKFGPIPAPVSCEAVRLGDSCYYKIVHRRNRSQLCFED